MTATISNIVAIESSQQRSNELTQPSDSSIARMDAALGENDPAGEEQAALNKGLEMFAVNMLMGTMRATSEAFSEIGSIDSSVEPEWMPERADDGSTDE